MRVEGKVNSNHTGRAPEAGAAAIQWHRAIAASRQPHPEAQLPMPSRTRARAQDIGAAHGDASLY